MEMLVYENNIEKDYQTVAVIDWKFFDQKVKKRPRSRIILEWKKRITND